MKADSAPTERPAESAAASAAAASTPGTTSSDDTPAEESTDKSDESAESGTATSGSPEMVTEPTGKFSTSVPAGWTTATEKGEVRLTAPTGDLRVHLVVVEQTELTAAVEQAWKQTEAGRQLAVEKRLNVPTDRGVDEQMVVDYEIGSHGRYAQAIAQRHDQMSYVILIDGTRASVEQYSEQLQLVGT
ncbi:MAG: hypothetical protein ABEN55_11620, partial [Bradymonadaceae bacterium]